MSLLPFQQFASTRISIVNLQIVHNRVGYVHKEESIRILYVIRRYVEKRKEKRVFNCTEKAQLKGKSLLPINRMYFIFQKESGVKKLSLPSRFL